MLYVLHPILTPPSPSLFIFLSHFPFASLSKQTAMCILLQQPPAEHSGGHPVCTVSCTLTNAFHSVRGMCV